MISFLVTTRDGLENPAPTTHPTRRAIPRRRRVIRTTCPQCGREDAIADYLATLPVMCKTCGHRVTMGEAIVPAKPALPPPVVASPLAPKAPPPSKAPLPPPPVEASKPKPQPKPEPAVALAPAPNPLPTPEPPVHTNGAVVAPRPSFTVAEGPGKIDLLDEDAPVSLSRFERPVATLPSPPPPSFAAAPLAHRGRRFAARLITLIGAAVALTAGILLAGFAPPVVKNNPQMQTAFLLLPLGLYALYNVVLLASQGQDFGKRVLKLKIVGDDGTPARFGRAFLKRELIVLLLLAGMVPFAWKLYAMQRNGVLAEEWQQKGWRMLTRMPEVLPAVAALLFSVLNAVVIFNKDGKCIHDKLAKTTVKA